jgi:hypothetical protein
LKKYIFFICFSNDFLISQIGFEPIHCEKKFLIKKLLSNSEFEDWPLPKNILSQKILFLGKRSILLFFGKTVLFSEKKKKK